MCETNTRQRRNYVSDMLVLLSIIFYLIPKFSTGAPAPSLFARQKMGLDVLAGSLPPCICTDSRSTSDIVWSCLATIFACSWVAIHPDISAPVDTRLTITLRRIEYMFWTILAPELMIYWAARQWFGVRYFFGTYLSQGAVWEGISRLKWTRTHAHFLQMRGFTLYDTNGESKGVLSLSRFRTLLGNNEIDVPTTTLKDIQDRSKSDGLAKVLVVGQTTWFVLQVIARRVQGLVTTELEIATLAFAALNGVMYFLWWDKPFDVQTSVPVYLVADVGSTNMRRTPYGDVPNIHDLSLIDEPSESRETSTQRLTQSFLRLLIESPRKIFRFVAGRLNNITENYLEFEVFQDIESSTAVAPSRVPLFYAIILSSGNEIKTNVMVATIAAIFGAIHCSAWFFAFPSNAERWLWRIGSLLITWVPLAFFMLLFLGHGSLKPFWRRPHEDNDFLQRDILPYHFMTLLPLYAIARLILVVQALIALRDLPQGAFDVVKWTTFIPHI